MRQLQPRQFQYHIGYAKDIGVDPNTVQYGFVADEVESVLKECVFPTSTHCYGGQMADYLAGRAPMPTPLPGLMNLKNYNIHNILIHSIQAIKELADRGDDLQRQIDDLKK